MTDEFERWLRANRGVIWLILVLACVVFWMGVYRLIAG